MPCSIFSGDRAAAKPDAAGRQIGLRLTLQQIGDPSDDGTLASCLAAG